jgi:uncharacterized membrane protein
MAQMRRDPNRLDIPIESRSFQVPRLPSEEFGQWSEDVARFFGTVRYLSIQTVIVIVWITLNLLPVFHVIRWDPYPFILLNLAFSTQAAYAAPFILFATNRQDERDRVQIEADREQAAQQRAVTDFISREIASVRMIQGETASRQFVRTEVARQLAELRESIREDLREELARAA